MTITYEDLCFCVCSSNRSSNHCWHETNTFACSPDGKAHKWIVCCNCGLHMTRPTPIGTLPQHDAPHGEFAPAEADSGQWKAARGALLDFGDAGDLSALPKASQGVIFVEADPNGGSPFVSKDDFNSTALATLEQAISLVEELTHAACSRSENGKTILDSMAVRVYAEAIDFLAGCGKVRITGDYGRRVIAEPIRDEDNAAPGS